MYAVLYTNTEVNRAVVRIALLHINVLDTAAMLGDAGGERGNDAAFGLNFYPNIYQKLTAHRGCPINVADFLRVIAKLGNIAASLLVDDQTFAGADMADNRITRDGTTTAGKGNEHTFG